MSKDEIQDMLDEFDNRSILGGMGAER